MQTDKWTIKAQEALAGMQQEAQSRRHQEMDLEHLLLALLNQPESLVLPVMKQIGAEPSLIRHDLDEALKKRSTVEGSDEQYSSRALSAALQEAQQEATRLKDVFVST